MKFCLEQQQIISSPVSDMTLWMVMKVCWLVHHFQTESVFETTPSLIYTYSIYFVYNST